MPEQALRLFGLFYGVTKWHNANLIVKLPINLANLSKPSKPWASAHFVKRSQSKSGKIRLWSIGMKSIEAESYEEHFERTSKIKRTSHLDRSHSWSSCRRGHVILVCFRFGFRWLDCLRNHELWNSTRPNNERPTSEEVVQPCINSCWCIFFSYQNQWFEKRMLFAEMAISLPTNSCRMLGKVERTVVVDTTTIISTFEWFSKSPKSEFFYELCRNLNR